MKERTVTLESLKKNQRGIIVSISAGRKVIQKLADMGLTIGTEFKIEAEGRLCPVKISFKGSELVLGDHISSKISVRVKE